MNCTPNKVVGLMLGGLSHQGHLATTRSQWQALAMAPGVRMTSVDVGGNQLAIQGSYRTYGINGQNSPEIEGILTRQVDNGTGMFYDYATFDEVQIKPVGTDADVAPAGTSFLSIVKSGGNDFHGSYFAGGSTKGMVSVSLDDSLRAQGATSGDDLLYFRDISGDLGGRIVRDKLWFYGGIRRQEASSNRTGYAKAPGQCGTSDPAADTSLTARSASSRRSLLADATRSRRDIRSIWNESAPVSPTSRAAIIS